jgi:hypothetical protein
VAYDLAQVDRIELRFTLFDETAEVGDDPSSPNGLLVNVRQKLDDFGRVNVPGPLATGHRQVGNRRERLAELEREAADEFADGAHPQGIGQLALPLPHALLFTQLALGLLRLLGVAGRRSRESHTPGKKYGPSGQEVEPASRLAASRSNARDDTGADRKG